MQNEKKKGNRRVVVLILSILLIGLLIGMCLYYVRTSSDEFGKVPTGEDVTQEENIPMDNNTGEDVIEDSTVETDIGEEGALSDENDMINVPTEEEVLAMRAVVTEGMSEEEIERLRENVKIANIAMERAYLQDDLFGKLGDKDSLYWNYFDQAGDIQIGWSTSYSLKEMVDIRKKEDLTEKEFYEQYGEPIVAYNRFDADNFIELFEDMEKSVQNEKLSADLQYIMDEVRLAADTHEMEHANNAYKMLHDMDYFLLRYGMTDVGNYVMDRSVIGKYYGVLCVYSDENPYTEE